MQSCELYSDGGQDMVVAVIPESGLGTDGSLLPALMCETELQSPSSTIQGPILTGTWSTYKKFFRGSLRAW